MDDPACRIVAYDALATNKRVFDSIDCPVVALVDSAVEPNEPGLAELARLMTDSSASVAFGTLEIASSWPNKAAGPDGGS